MLYRSCSLQHPCPTLLAPCCFTKRLNRSPPNLPLTSTLLHGSMSRLYIHLIISSSCLMQPQLVPFGVCLIHFSECSSMRRSRREKHWTTTSTAQGWFLVTRFQLKSKMFDWAFACLHVSRGSAACLTKIWFFFLWREEKSARARRKRKQTSCPH